MEYSIDSSHQCARTSNPRQSLARISATLAGEPSGEQPFGVKWKGKESLTVSVEKNIEPAHQCARTSISRQNLARFSATLAGDFQWRCEGRRQG